MSAIGRAATKTTKGTKTEPRFACDARVEVADFGAFGGVLLAAEYDAEDDVIRVNVRAIDVVRRSLGDAEALRFTACAVAHERFHRANRDASEAAARAYAATETGTEVGRYETVLAGCGRGIGAGFTAPVRGFREVLARAARG